MKKTIFVLLLILAALLTACDSPSAEPSETTAPTTPTTSEPDIHISYAPLLFYAEEYDAYLEHFRTDSNVPDNFIHYDNLRDLGSFSMFCNLVYHPNNSYEWYYYLITDSVGNELSVSIYHRKPNSYSANIPTEAINSQDMRNLLDENAGYRYIHNGIVYYYRSGKLENISWDIDGITFRLSMSSPQYFSDVSETHPIIQAFLSLDTADEAVARFAEMISQP